MQIRKSKKYVNVSKEQKAIYDARYREKHYDQLKTSQKEYYEKNKDRIISRSLEYQRTFQGRLKHNLRTRIGNALSRKSNSTKDLLGCDIDFYISYLEYFFDEYMSWENYGSYWHIDHVNPICNFDISQDDQQKLAFHWTNTRPLSSKENLSKSKKVNLQDINNHNNLIEQFLNATLSNCGKVLTA